MASSVINQFSLFLLLTFLSSLHCTHARDGQFFNKVTTTKIVDPVSKQPLNNQQEEPKFLPENKNSYGLYGHDSTQLSPSTTAQPLNKYLPKNYNPVAYVTEPEDTNESPIFTEDSSFTSNPENNNYYNQEGEKPRYRNNINNNNYYYNGGNRFNNHPKGLSGTRFNGAATFNGGSIRPQGMSDTRSLENGKYFYDVNADRYNNNPPYENQSGNRARNEYSNNNFYGNNENAYEFNSENSVGGYQNLQQDEFQDGENNLP